MRINKMYRLGTGFGINYKISYYNIIHTTVRPLCLTIDCLVPTLLESDNQYLGIR